MERKSAGKKENDLSVNELNAVQQEYGAERQRKDKKRAEFEEWQRRLEEGAETAKISGKSGELTHELSVAPPVVKQTPSLEGKIAMLKSEEEYLSYARKRLDAIVQRYNAIYHKWKDAPSEFFWKFSPLFDPIHEGMSHLQAKIMYGKPAEWVADESEEIEELFPSVEALLDDAESKIGNYFKSKKSN